MLFIPTLLTATGTDFTHKNIKLTIGLDKDTTPRMEITRSKLISNVQGLHHTTIGVLIKQKNGTPICKYNAKEASFNVFQVHEHRIRGMQIYWSLGFNKKHKDTKYSIYKIKQGQEQSLIHSHFLGSENNVDIHYIDSLKEHGAVLSTNLDQVRNCYAIQ